MKKKQIGGRTPHYAGGAPTEASGSAATAAPVTRHQPATPTQVREEMVFVGYSLALDAIRGRDWKPLNQAIADANSSDLILRQAGLSVLFGAAHGLSAVLHGVGESGLAKINGHVPTSDEITYALATDVRRFDAVLQCCIQTVNTLMDKAPELCAAIPKRRSAAAEPQEVRVISMPARETASKVRRDDQGNIISTTSIEQDVA